MRCACIALALLAFACSKKDNKVPPAEPALAVDADATKAFWTWFARHAPALRADPDLEKTMETIGAELAKVNPGVFAEIGKDGDNRLLVLSVDGKKDLFPIVERIFAARPEVPGWKVVAFRPRNPQFALKMGDTQIKFADLKFVATPNGSKLDVDVFMPAVGDEETTARIGFLMLDHAVGEYDMEMKVGGIEFKPIDKAPKDARRLTELGAAVDATK